MNRFLKFILALLTCWSMANVAVAQGTVAEKKKQADEFFEDQNWLAAEPLYASVISGNPKNHDLNFRYGTCILLGSKNKTDAINRLRYAVTGVGIDTRAFYYLGRAYHLNYQFNDAIKQYKRFQQVATPGLLKELDVVTDLKACNNGKRLLTNITDMIVIQKTELGTGSFYDLYDLDDIGGNIIVTDIFQSKLDKKRNHRPVIHFPSESPYIYYSSYGEDGSTGLDIYVKQQLPGGEWSLAQKVRGQVNTDLDEDYAYMHPNGEYLYFCSKGHNSMGGYDVFRSKYDPGTQTFGVPENLDFAISSPDDDLLFVVDSLDKVAYFSSARESNQGNITVYKVRVDRIPMQMAVIKGNFLNTVNPNDKELEIEVEDVATGSVIGTFNTKKTNGDYLLTFPKGGKYKFFITPKGSDITDVYIIDVPYTKEFKPLKQSMTMELNENGEEFVQITNQFGDGFDDPVAVMAEVYREISKLPPNANQFNLDSLDAIKVDDEVFVDAGLDPFITEEGLQQVLANEVEEIQEARFQEQLNANVAYNLAIEKSNLANEEMLALNELLAKAESEKDPNEKTKILQEALAKKEEVEKLNNEAQSLIEFGKSIDLSIAEKQAELDAANKLLAESENIGDGDRGAVADLVKNNQEFFASNVKDKDGMSNMALDALREGAEVQREMQDLSNDISELSKVKNGLLKENEDLKRQLSLAKKKKDIEALQTQIADNESDIIVLENDIDAKTEALDEMVKENAMVKKGLAAAIILKDDFVSSDYERPLSNYDKQMITDQVVQNDLAANLKEVDTVLEENEVSIFNIDLYANTEETSAYDLEGWNDAIDKEQKRLREEKMRADAEKQRKLQAEIDRLDRLRQEKLAEFTIVEDDPTTINSDVDQYEILPDYERRTESIGEIVNEADRRKAQNDLDYEVLDEITAEKKKLEQILVDNPKSKNIKDRLANLEILENDLKKNINNNEEWIVVNDGNAAVTNEEVLSNLDADYQNKLNTAWEIIDEDERNKAVGDLNQIILEKANERVQELEAILAEDSNNGEAKAEYEYLQSFITNVNANKFTPIIEPSGIDLANLSEEVLVTDLINDFDKRQSEIAAIQDEYKRRKAENVLYRELIDKTRTELSALDALAIENPDNKTIKKRQEALRDIDREYSKALAKNEEWLAKNQVEETVYADVNTVRQANPDYQTEIDRISEEEVGTDKTEAIQQLNEETITQIDNRIASLEEDINNNTASDASAEEKLALENLRIQIQEDLTVPVLDESDLSNINTSPNVADIMPQYAKELQDIEQSRRTDEEKELAKISLNERLITMLDGELRAIEGLTKSNPSKADDLAQRAAVINELKQNAEDNIQQSKDAITANEVVADRAEISIEALMPSYNSDINNIRNSANEEKNKLLDENEQHEMLLAAVDYQTGKLKDERSANPDLETIITKELAELDQIKLETEAILNANNVKIANLSSDVTDNTGLNRPEISIATLMPNYELTLANIKRSNNEEKDKLNEQNDTHKDLITEIDKKIAALEIEKEGQPALDEIISEEISDLQTLKAKKEAEIAANTEEIARLNNTDIADNNDPDNSNPDNNNPENNDPDNNNNQRASITIGTLMPNYLGDLADVDNSARTEIEKLTQKNELHKELISTIEDKIDELEKERDNNPNLSQTIAAEIDVLNELKANKEAEIAANNEEIANLNNSVAQQRATISIGSLMPNYNSKIADIRNGSSTDIEKLEKENEVNSELIDLIASRQEELENEKADNPENSAAINVDLEKLKNIERSTQNSININNDQIAAQNGNQLNRPSITIGTLIPEYETRLAAINNSDALKADKLIEKNELDNELIRSIDAKIEAIQEEWEVDPNNGFTYNQEINKLEELKAAKQRDIDNNEVEIESLIGANAEVADISATDFDDPINRNTVNSLSDDVAGINELKSDIASLKNELNNTNDAKKRAKLEKEISKLEIAKAKLENSTIEDLEDVNKVEIANLKEELTLDKALTENSISLEKSGVQADIDQANENLEKAERKLDQAQVLRNQAADEKDPLAANEKLTTAYDLEVEAKELVKEAKRIFRMGTAINEFTVEVEVVTDVPDNVSDRESTEKFEEATALREEADKYYNRATALKDSSATVKKKYRDQVLEMASGEEAKGDRLYNQADQAEYQAEELKKQEDEVVEKTINTVEKEVDLETADDVATSEVYKDYFNQKNEGDRQMEQAGAIDEQIENLKKKRERRYRIGTAINQNPQTAFEEDEELNEIQNKIDSLTTEKLRLRDEALANYDNANAILSTQTQDNQENLMVLEQNDVQPYERIVEADSDYDIPVFLNRDIFRTTETAVYSDEAPIPVDEISTSGLVYKVQVGAFRKPLPPDHFSEFAPISGEKLNNGITRFMVGYFRTFDPASEAKGKVNALGYEDAFVVAYCNGERITIDRAKLIEDGLLSCEATEPIDENTNISINDTNNGGENPANNTGNNTGNNDSNGNNGTAQNNDNSEDGNNDNTTEIENNNSVENNGVTTYVDQSQELDLTPQNDEERIATDYYNNVPNAAKANQVEIIDGLFYTVQIGVYSKPVPNSSLFNIQPLNSQRTESGFIRYSTGIFTSVEQANVRKGEVVNIGVQDAFVTAYFNGERITVEQALEILVQQGAEALVGNKSAAESEAANNVVDVTEVPFKETFYTEALHYRILVGKYAEAIPGEYATLLLRGDGVFETEVDQNGNTCLVSKKINTYNDMVDMLAEFADLGIEDMDVVTYYKYDVIPFEEGEAIRNEGEIQLLHPYDDMVGISANKFIYNKEAVYFKIKLGEFEEKVPADFANLLLLHEEEENISKEETVDDESIFTTGRYLTIEEAEAAQERLREKGFDLAVIIAYHKYEEISLDKAVEILEE